MAWPTVDQRAPGTDAAHADLRREEDLARPDLRPPPPDFAGLDLSGVYLHVRVNEVAPAVGGMNADEFVELVGGAVDVPLQGYTLRYQSAAGGDSVLVTFGPVTVPRDGYLLVAAMGSRYGTMADVVFSPGGSGRLARGGGAVGLFSPAGARVDSLAWGTATGSYVEGKGAAPAPGDLGCSRIPDGIDTDHNEADVRQAEPTPRAANRIP